MTPEWLSSLYGRRIYWPLRRARCYFTGHHFRRRTKFGKHPNSVCNGCCRVVLHGGEQP